VLAIEYALYDEGREGGGGRKRGLHANEADISIHIFESCGPLFLMSGHLPVLIFRNWSTIKLLCQMMI